MSVLSVSGGNLAKHRAAFSADGSLFMCPSASHVKLFSARTGEELGTLSGHSAEVTAVVASPVSSQQALTASLDGTLGAWDLSDGAMLQRFDLGAPIHALHVQHGRTDSALVVVASSADAGGGGDSAHLELKLRTASLESRGGRLIGVTLAPPPTKKRLAKLRRAHTAAGAAAGGGAAEGGGASLLTKRLGADAPIASATIGGVPVYAARATSDDRSVRVCNGATGETVTVSAEASVHCVALHPTELAVALGDGDGVVTVWTLGSSAASTDAAAAASGAPPVASGAGGRDGGGVRSGSDGGTLSLRGRPVRTLKHWHASAVGALAYTPDGLNLLSAGAECALVVWSARGGPAERRIVPRLGAPIVSIAVAADGSSYALSCADNCVRVVSAASLELVCAGRGLQPAAPAGRALALDGRRAELVLPVRSAPGTLQFWALGEARHARTLCVAEANAGALLPMQESSVARAQRAARRAGARAAAGGAPAGAGAGVGGGRAPVCAVVFVGFTADCNALVTVELRPDAELAMATALKFWTATDSREAGGSGSTSGGGGGGGGGGAGAAAAAVASARGAVAAASSGWLLHTRVDSPHEREVTALACSPYGGARLAATTGRDGALKLWQWSAGAAGAAGAGGPAGASNGGRWSCLAVGGYRQQELLDAAFSADGSVLAVLCATCVTLWEPHSCELLRVLAGSGGSGGALGRSGFTALLLGGAAAVAPRTRAADGDGDGDGDGGGGDGFGALGSAAGSLAGFAEVSIALAYGAHGVTVWDLSTGLVLEEFELSVVTAAADSSTGEVLVCAALRTDAEDEQQPARLDAAAGVVTAMGQGVPSAAAAAGGYAAVMGGARGGKGGGSSVKAVPAARRVTALLRLRAMPSGALGASGVHAAGAHALADSGAGGRPLVLPVGAWALPPGLVPAALTFQPEGGVRDGADGGVGVLLLSTAGELWQLQLQQHGVTAEGAGGGGATGERAGAGTLGKKGRRLLLPPRARGGSGSVAARQLASGAQSGQSGPVSAFARAFRAADSAGAAAGDPARAAAMEAGKSDGNGAGSSGVARWIARTFGEAPAHSLPPLTRLFESFAQIACSPAASAPPPVGAGGAGRPDDKGGGIAARAAAAAARARTPDSTSRAIEMDAFEDGVVGAQHKRSRPAATADDEIGGWARWAKAAPTPPPDDWAAVCAIVGDVRDGVPDGEAALSDDEADARAREGDGGARQSAKRAKVGGARRGAAADAAGEQTLAAWRWWDASAALPTAASDALAALEPAVPMPMPIPADQPAAVSPAAPAHRVASAAALTPATTGAARARAPNGRAAPEAVASAEPEPPHSAPAPALAPADAAPDAAPIAASDGSDTTGGGDVPSPAIANGVTASGGGRRSRSNGKPAAVDTSAALAPASIPRLPASARRGGTAASSAPEAPATRETAKSAARGAAAIVAAAANATPAAKPAPPTATPSQAETPAQNGPSPPGVKTRATRAARTPRAA